MGWLKKLGVFILFLAVIIASLKKAGPFDPPICSLTFRTFGCLKVELNGFVAPGWEPLVEQFAKQFKEGKHLASQLSVWKEGKSVVDVAASYGVNLVDLAKDDVGKSYSLDGLQIIYSTTKALYPIVVAKLVEKGLLDYYTPISKYWPAFAQNGKEKITLAELLRHEAGLDALDEPIPWKVFRDLDNPKDLIRTRIEKSTPKWSTISRRAYHTLTRGLIINELVKIVDPKNRSIGKIFDEEIAKPLGVDCWIGLPKEQFGNVFRLHEGNPSYMLLNVVVPFLTNSLSPDAMKLFKSFKDKDSWMNIRGSGILGPNGEIDLSPNFLTSVRDYPEALSTECPSSNGISNAKSLSKIFSMLALGGEIDGIRILKPETVKAMLYISTESMVDSMLSFNTTFTDGGYGKGLLPVEDKNWYGWAGMGGSVGQFNPIEKLSFSLTITGMAVLYPDERGTELIEKLIETHEKNKK